MKGKSADTTIIFEVIAWFVIAMLFIKGLGGTIDVQLSLLIDKYPIGLCQVLFSLISLCIFSIYYKKRFATGTASHRKTLPGVLLSLPIILLSLVSVNFTISLADVSVLIIAFAGALSEELCFRIIPLKLAFGRNTAVLTAVLSSIVFGLYHAFSSMSSAGSSVDLPMVGLWQIATSIFVSASFGLAMAGIYLLSNSGLCIVMVHAINNILVINYEKVCSTNSCINYKKEVLIGALLFCIAAIYLEKGRKYST